MKEKTNYPSIDKTHLQGISNFKLHPFIPNISVYNSIKLMNIPYMNNIAIDCLDLKLNYKEMIKNSNVIAKSLIELGVKPGEIITIWMPNYAQAVEIFLAANKIGVTVSFINSFAKKEETVDTTILAGQTFDKKYDTYYVVFYDFDSDSSVTSRLENISTNKVFKVNTKDKLNSSVINTSSNAKASSADELKINGVTLIKIENGKNVEYVEGLSNVLSSLSNLK